MAEPVDQENKLVENRQEEEETNEENGETDASILAGLNLVMIVSLLSLSEEECSNFEEIQEMETGNNDRKAKNSESRCSSLQIRKQQVNQFPALEKQTSRFHTKIRDSRHCRKF